MTRLFILIALLSIMLFSCRSKNAEPVLTTADTVKPLSQAKFFPVTEFLKGEIYEIRANYKVPLKKFKVNGKQDSIWLKMEDLEKEFADFLSPVIDSSKLASQFKETSFNDQTLDAITLSYEPTQLKPDSLVLQKWDVYINPNTGKVKRIYMVKNIAGNREQQLTWQTGEYAKIAVLKYTPEGQSSLENEVTYTWDY